MADPAGRRLVLLDTAGGIAGKQLQLDPDIEQPGALAVGGGGRLAVHCTASSQIAIFGIED